MMDNDCPAIFQSSYGYKVIKMKTAYQWNRIVLKVGSALIAPDGKICSSEYLLPLASFVQENLKKGKEVIIVSSGAIASGLSVVAQPKSSNHRTIPQKQALAAIGQAKLMQHWQRFFDVPCAQMLLTLSDLKNRQSFINAKNTLNQILEMGAIPIINENDSVAIDELKVGDNDNLAAHVAALADADLLVICSDVEGLYNKNPSKHSDAKLLSEVLEITPDIMAMAETTANPIATGGMLTKLHAASKAVERGINSLIINGKNSNNFKLLTQEQSVGTFFHRQRSPMAARKHWLNHLQTIKGAIVIDAGAAKALTTSGASLLASGIIAIKGQFVAGDVVSIEIMDHLTQESASQNRLLGKGISQYANNQLIKIQGKKSQEFEEILGFLGAEEVIHRDDLILLKTND